MAYMALGFNKRLVTRISTRVPRGTSPSQGTTSLRMSARPHCSSRAATKGSAPTTWVSTRVRASIFRLLGKRQRTPPLTKDGTTARTCPHQPQNKGAEREEYGEVGNLKARVD